MSKTRQKTRSKTSGINKVQSLMLVKNLIRTSVSCICFLRNVFPDKCFQTKDMGGVNINTLKRGSKHEEAEKIIDWMERGVFDALEKEFLDALVFSIYATIGGRKNIMEEYHFKVKYPERKGGKHAIEVNRGNKLITKTDIKGMTCQMMRMLITLAQTLKPVPADRYLSMKLTYLDHCPDDYEPNFFRPLEDRDEVWNFSTNSKRDKLRIGHVQTGKHEMVLKIDTTRDNFKDDEDAAEEADEEVADEVTAAHEELQLAADLEESCAVEPKAVEPIAEQPPSPAVSEPSVASSDGDEGGDEGTVQSQEYLPNEQADPEPEVEEMSHAGEAEDGAELDQAEPLESTLDSTLEPTMESDAQDTDAQMDEEDAADAQAAADYEMFKDIVTETNNCTIKVLAERFDTDRDTIRAYLDQMVDDELLRKCGRRYAFPKTSKKRKSRKRGRKKEQTPEPMETVEEETQCEPESAKKPIRNTIDEGFTFGGKTPMKNADDEDISPTKTKKVRSRRRKRQKRSTAFEPIHQRVDVY